MCSRECTSQVPEYAREPPARMSSHWTPHLPLQNSAVVHGQALSGFGSDSVQYIYDMTYPKILLWKYTVIINTVHFPITPYHFTGSVNTL